MLTRETIEFLAEDELLDINPKIRLPILRLLTGYVGPFIPGRLIKVPAWLAICLRKDLLCTIIQPNWLSVNYLKDWLDRERLTPNQYLAPPSFYFIELAHLILGQAEDDVIDCEILRRLVYSIVEVRKKKTCASFKDFNLYADAMPGKISHSELNQVRPFYYKAIQMMQMARDTSEQLDPMEE